MYPGRAKQPPSSKPAPRAVNTRSQPSTKPTSQPASRSSQPSKMPVGDPDAGLILRIFSKAGRSRIETTAGATLDSLFQEISKRMSVDAQKIALYQDEAYRRKLQGRASDALASLGLKQEEAEMLRNGDILYLKNEEAVITNIAKPSKRDVYEEEKKKKELEEKVNPSASPMKEPEKSLEEEVKLKEQEEQKKKEETQKGVDGDSDFKKHQSFEPWLQQYLKTYHFPPPIDFNFKVKKDCSGHPPYPRSVCSKCMPQTANLNRQRYRHVDYVCFMNFDEVQGFVSEWQQNLCMRQRVGFLYGYYSEDPNYPQGVRVNIEAIYEPPQDGDINGFHILQNPAEEEVVERLAHHLTLERVGWIFTSINHEMFLTSREIRLAAEFQERYKKKHPTQGWGLSKFVTAVLKPGATQFEAKIECYMVSDQCQALYRDNVFAENDSNKKMQVRAKKHDTDMLPMVMKENKPVTQFEPDFFIVSLAHGQPKKKRDYNILKLYDFPAENRLELITKSDLITFLTRHKMDKPNWKRFASFHFLLYLAKILDLGTAEVVAKSIAEEKPLERVLVDQISNLK